MDRMGRAEKRKTTLQNPFYVFSGAEIPRMEIMVKM